MCQGKASLSYHIYGYYIRIVKRNQFLLSGRAVFHCRYKCLHEWCKSSFQPTEKQFPNTHYLQKQTVLYYSNFVKKITLCNQKFWTFPFRLSFVLRQKQVVLQHLYIAIRPHIFSAYNVTRSVVERTPHSHIQRYFCHKHDAHELICLSIFFCQYYCNSSLFLFTISPFA